MANQVGTGNPQRWGGPVFDYQMGLFSIVKWASFRLSRFSGNEPSEPVFACQMGLFWVDKNTCLDR
jgi:hypothetical protein